MQFKHICLGLLVSLIWSGNYIMIKLGANNMPPILLTLLRFVLVSAILLPVVKKPDIPWKTLTLMAITIGVFHHVALFVAIWLELEVSASILVSQSAAPLTVLLSAIALKEKITKKSILGIILAFSGILVITGNPTHVSSLIPLFFAIISAIGSAVFNVIIKKLGNVPILSMTAYTSLIIVIILLPMTIILENPNMEQLLHMPIEAYASIGFMAISSIVGFGFWFYLLQRYPVALISGFGLLVPIIGLYFTKIFLYEHLGRDMIIGSILTITGVTVIVTPNNVKELITRRFKKDSLTVVTY